MNVLLTCAGRRGYLIQYFREALAGSGFVYAADCNTDAAAMLEADAAFPVPPVDDPCYCDVLLALCQRHQVDFLIPLNDLELPYIAAWQPRLLAAGTVPLISSPTVIDTCWDKWKAYQFLTANGLPTPLTFCTLKEATAALSCGELTYPVVVKPRWGSASFYIELCSDEEQLALAHSLVTRRTVEKLRASQHEQDPCCYVLLQQYIAGQEFAMDVVNDLTTRYVCTLAKRKLAMRAGETDRAVTVNDDQLTDLGRKIGQAVGHVGMLDCDVIVADDGPRILDLNPRFGGGYPFSHAAGANIPAALLAWVSGALPDPRWFTIAPAIMSAKCDQLIVREVPVTAPDV